jgi:hypothetical protein
MEFFKQTISKFIYRIEPKPDGGFIARTADGAMPPLEASTREELQQKIQEAISATLATEFPGLKLPLESRELKYSFHIEPKIGGGFIAHSTDPNHPPIEGATHEEVQHGLAEKLAGALGSYLLPQLSQAAGTPINSGDIKVFVNRKVGFSASVGSNNVTLGDAQGLPPAGSVQTEDGKNQSLVGLADNSPIVPVAGGNWRVFRFLLTLAILAVVMYFYLHRR